MPMKLLLTGAFSYTDAQVKKIRALGFETVFVRDERVPIQEDVSCFDAAVCNALFLYNDISRFTRLRFIQLTSAGMERVPLEYASSRNIRVANAAGIYSIPMSEWAVLKVLEMYKSSRKFYESQRLGLWRKERDILELNGRKVAIIGFGSVGQETAKRLRPFGVYIFAVDNRVLGTEETALADEVLSPNKIDALLGVSDIVILSLPLSEETRNFMNRERIFRMKRGSVIVNLARGGLLDEQALAEALAEGILFGAALDVFVEEPLPEKSPLWNMENVIITPHNSFVSDKNGDRLFNLILSNLRDEIKRG
ncbi:MAG TPA: NAD(P)-dependent oxidoreductase [bacterium]|nr:NAD(P)-dependent oxidoreductase [bacterium]